MFGAQVSEDAKADAIRCFPNESCGVIVKIDDDFTYVSLPNVAEDPLESFKIDERVLFPHRPHLVAVVHSHPNGPDCPSESDMRQQLAFAVPFGIVSTDGVGCYEPFFWGEGTPRAPLIGRGFRHGVTDCYALCRDYYREVCGIILNEYPREWCWWNNGQKLYEDFLEIEGFVRIEEKEVREHDAFLAQLHSKTPNHAGVYVGNSLVLHHLTSNKAYDPSRISKRDPVGAWSKFICGQWVRHRSLF